MITTLLAAFLIAGQQPCAGGAPPKNAPDCIPVLGITQGTGITTGITTPPAPLKCGKYQHEEYPSVWCGDSMPSTCFTPRCAPDLHTVTEREWQELMEHIRWIDHIRKEQCPSLSWINGRCIPSCKDDPNGSCKPDPPKEQR